MASFHSSGNLAMWLGGEESPGDWKRRVWMACAHKMVDQCGPSAQWIESLCPPIVSVYRTSN